MATTKKKSSWVLESLKFLGTAAVGAVAGGYALYWAQKKFPNAFGSSEPQMALEAPSSGPSHMMSLPPIVPMMPTMPVMPTMPMQMGYGAMPTLQQQPQPAPQYPTYVQNGRYDEDDILPGDDWSSDDIDAYIEAMDQDTEYDDDE